MSGSHHIRVTLDISEIDYRQLDAFASKHVSGMTKLAVHALLTGLDSLDSATSDKTLVKGANTFKGVILNMLNQNASDLGLRFSDISFSG